MSRKYIVKTHMFIAAFFAPVMIVTALSGGLYLFGEKGRVEQEIIYTGSKTDLNHHSEDLKSQVVRFLQDKGIDADFEDIKIYKNAIWTQPTSRTFYIIKERDNELVVSRNTPNFIKKIAELHNGNGPIYFKVFQRFLAVGLIFMVVSGLWLGLNSANLRKTTLIISSTGTVIFLALVIF